MKITRKQLRNPKFLKSLKQPVVLLTDLKHAPPSLNQLDTLKNAKLPMILTDLKHVPGKLTLRGTPKNTASKRLPQKFTRRDTPKNMMKPVIRLTDLKHLPRTFTDRDTPKNTKQPVILLTDLKHLPRTLALPNSPNIIVTNGLGRVSFDESIEGDISQTSHDTIQTINGENISQTEDLGSTSAHECVEVENSQTSHYSDEIVNGESLDHTEDNDEVIIDENKRDENTQSNHRVNETTSKSLISHAEVEYDENNFRSCDNPETAMVTKEPQTLKCGLCCKIFLSCDAVLDHVLNCLDHSKTCTNNFIFTCTACYMFFVSESDLELHLILHENESLASTCC